MLAAPPQPTALRSVHTANLPALFDHLQISLVVSTYQAQPRRVRRLLQRRWKQSSAGVALLLALQPGSSEAMDLPASNEAELVAVINTANITPEADTITLTAANAYFHGPTGLPRCRAPCCVPGQAARQSTHPKTPRPARAGKGGII